MKKKLKQKILDYFSINVPDDYKCYECRSTDCKLWRSYNSNIVKLYCANCVEKASLQKLNLEKSNQLNGYVPAIPNEYNNSFWGYSSTPCVAFDWWNRLITRPMKVSQQSQ
jgi:hypothetical protein